MGKYRNKDRKRVAVTKEPDDYDFDFDMSIYEREESDFTDESNLAKQKKPRISSFKFKFTPYELSAIVLSDLLKEMIKYGVKVGSYSDDIKDIKNLRACMLQYYFLLRPFLGSDICNDFDKRFHIIKKEIKDCRVGKEIDLKINDNLLVLEMAVIHCAQMKGALFLHDVRNTGMRSNIGEKIIQ